MMESTGETSATPDQAQAQRNQTQTQGETHTSTTQIPAPSTTRANTDTATRSLLSSGLRNMHINTDTRDETAAQLHLQSKTQTITSSSVESYETGPDSPDDLVTPISIGSDGSASHQLTEANLEKLSRNLAASRPAACVSSGFYPVPAPTGAPEVHSPPNPVPDQDLIATTVRRRSTRSSGVFGLTMSALFRRTNSHSASNIARPNITFTQPNFTEHAIASYSESNSPPTPASPLEMAAGKGVPDGPVGTGNGSIPKPEEFKKTRATTGFSLRSRGIGFVGGNGQKPEKQGRKFPLGRRRSFDQQQAKQAKHPEGEQHQHAYRRSHIQPSPWPQMPDAGVGVKSRRLSISLPDDFHVEVADLLSEYYYQNKLWGRHGKHLGKGATSKVTLMVRKGFPNEFYAVKEFRNKTKAETSDDYEKKVKSEYSIAKSLHHPNIVETVQLCTDHGRWNHVMEYCGDGDLYQLVEKGYLKDAARASDRLCLFKQLVQGVNFLHSNGIAHRDIKLENCLISGGCKLKITDFGVSEVFSGTHPGLREAGGQCGQNMNDVRLCSPGICGSEPYIAPEVLRKEQSYDPRGMDVWGTAIVMIYLIFGANIWKRAETGKGCEHYDLLVKQWDKWNARHPEPDARMSDSDYPYYFPFDAMIQPPALRRVLLMMLNPDPQKRASISEIANHRWVKNIECCQFDSYDDPAKYIDASKKGTTHVNGQKKIFCHNHLPLQSQGHSLGKMPGQTGY